jgi:hypothetical protein
MKNLQELYDAYIATRPYSGKIKSATSMLIHACKALNLATQEDITVDYFDDIPEALNRYFKNYPLKSTQDKAILAEMIGRVGLNDNLKGMLDKLLTDHDENVRQYSLHSLGYIGKTHPEKVLPFIERYRKSNDYTMKSVAAHLLSHLATSENQDFVLSKINEWHDEGDMEFVQDVAQKIVDAIKQGAQKSMPLDQFIEWFKTNFDNKIEIRY